MDVNDTYATTDNPIHFVLPEAAPNDAFTGPEFEQFGGRGRVRPGSSSSVSCTACGKDVSLFLTRNAIQPHPVLNVLICKQCLDFYYSGKFTQDEFGIDEHCQWCGEGGNLLLCDKCTRAFCNYCIKRNFSKKQFEQIRDSTKWDCFVCNNKPLRSKIIKCTEVMKLQSAHFGQSYHPQSQRLDMDNSRSSFPSCLTEENKSIDDLILPLENQAKGPSEKHNIAPNPAKKVEPLTILREKENYIVFSKSGSPSPDFGRQKVKLVLRSQSDPENNQSFKSRSKDRNDTNLFPNVKSLEKTSDLLDNGIGKLSASVNAKLIDGMKTGEFEHTKPTKRNKKESSTSSEDSEYLAESDSDLTDADQMMISDPSPSESSSYSNMVSGSAKDSKSELKNNVSCSESDQSLKSIEANVQSSETPSQEEEPMITKTPDKNDNQRVQKKLEEADKCISQLQEIFAEIADYNCLQDANSVEKCVHSPTQFSQYKTAAKLVKTIKNLEIKLTSVKDKISSHKIVLGKFRMSHSGDSGSSSSTDDNNPADEATYRRESWKEHKKTQKAKSLSSSLPANSSMEISNTLPDNTQSNKDGGSSSSSVEFPYVNANKPAKLYNAKVMIKKLTDDDIKQFSRKHTKISDNDDTDSSKAAFRTKSSRTIFSTSGSSEDFNELKSRMKKLCKLHPKLKSKTLGEQSDKENFAEETQKTSLEKTTFKKPKHPLSDSSDDEFSVDSDATEFSSSKPSPDKTGVSGTLEDNDIAINLLLKRMEEDSEHESDSDVDELLKKKARDTNLNLGKTEKMNNEDTNPATKNNYEDRSEGPSSDGTTDGTNKTKTKYRHPLLNKNIEVSDGEKNKRQANKGGNLEPGISKETKKRKSSVDDDDDDEPVPKKTRRRLQMNHQNEVLLSSGLELSTDSDESLDFGKKQKKVDIKDQKNRRLKMKIESDSTASSSEEESFKKLRREFDGSNNLLGDKDKQELKSSEEEQNDSGDDIETRKRKPYYKIFEKRKRRFIINSDSSDDDVKIKEEPGIDQTDSAQKRGRRNIRNIWQEDKLSASTIQASQEELARRKRLEQNREAEVENEEVIVIDDETQSPKKKFVTARLKLSKSPLVEVHEELLKVLKPHQVDGIRFMWDNLIERPNDAKTKPGAGCILAHCMGLGKTLQSIAFLHTVLMSKHLPNLRTALIICPYGTVNNWVHEFSNWLRRCRSNSSDSKFEKLPVFELASTKGNSDRAQMLKRWQSVGGVMVVGYGLYRILMDETKRHLRHQKETFGQTLRSPGPSILICDEGHILKNTNSKIAQIVDMMETRRRIVLTGTPLQNNMVEYHCMVSIVKPKLLGTLKEFKNRFTNPIENGQHVDSTERDVKVMKKRAHVLHELLSGCVQRKDYTCLRSHLPPKYEFVLNVRMSDLQIRMYQHYLTMHSSADMKLRNGCLFTDFNTLLLLVCHPRCLVLAKERRERKEESAEDNMSKFVVHDKENENESSDESVVVISDSDSETEESNPVTEDDLDTMSKRKLKKFVEQKSGQKVSIKNHKKLWDLAAKYLDKNFCNTPEYTEALKTKSVQELKKMIIDNGGSYIGCTEKSDLISRIKMLKQSQVDEEWFEKLMPSQENLARVNIHSGKIVLMLEILHGATKVGDKVVIFSQSLLTLDLIEDVLKTETEDFCKGLLPKIEPYSKWYHGKDYFRLDGSIPIKLRDRWIKQFNNPNEGRGRLFLISTRAGGIGINLIGANRAIVFDASWNPTHDIQSIFRIYRFGQTKSCYVYRFIAQGTMEEKIYERQVVKQSLAFRVVDEQQIVRHFSAADIAELYTFKPAPKPVRKCDENGREITEDTPSCAPPRDSILASIIKANATRDVIVSYHEHDSLLDHQVSEELTEAERRAAWEEYDHERAAVERRELNINSIFSNVNLPALQCLSKKADEALKILSQKLGKLEGKSVPELMQAIRFKHRAMTTDEVSNLAVKYKLEEHIQRRNLTDLKKYIMKKKEEIEHWWQVKNARPSIQSAGLNLKNHAGSAPLPLSAGLANNTHQRFPGYGTSQHRFPPPTPQTRPPPRAQNSRPPPPMTRPNGTFSYESRNHPGGSRMRWHPEYHRFRPAYSTSYARNTTPHYNPRPFQPFPRNR